MNPFLEAKFAFRNQLREITPINNSTDFHKPTWLWDISYSTYFGIYSLG